MPKETVRLFILLFMSLLYASSFQQIYHPCLKSILFLYFSRDLLRSTMEIIRGTVLYPQQACICFCEVTASDAY